MKTFYLLFIYLFIYLFFPAINSGSVARVLLFNLTGDRDPHNLLRPAMVCSTTQLHIVPTHVQSH